MTNTALRLNLVLCCQRAVLCSKGTKEKNHLTRNSRATTRLKLKPQKRLKPHHLLLCSALGLVQKSPISLPQRFFPALLFAPKTSVPA